MPNGGRGRVVVISGPSGAGKSTVVRRVLERAPVPLVGSVSATTRRPRPGEVDGVDYHFLSEEEFARLGRQGAFLECFQVFGQDCWYGTLRQEVEPRLAAGQWVLLAIDVQGAQAVREHYPDTVTIFLDAASAEELERRLRGRQTENEEAIRTRLAQAQSERAAADRFAYRVVNEDVARAADEICGILRGRAH